MQTGDSSRGTNVAEGVEVDTGSNHSEVAASLPLEKRVIAVYDFAERGVTLMP
jgi:hypothetical protein